MIGEGHFFKVRDGYNIKQTQPARLFKKVQQEFKVCLRNASVIDSKDNVQLPFQSLKKETLIRTAVGEWQ